MANLSIVGSFKVNGVPKLHSELIKTSLVPEFYALWPEKFTNVTNGITPRRWLLHANHGLANLITEKVGKEWVTHLDKLTELEKFATDEKFVDDFINVKNKNKQFLAHKLFKLTGVLVN